MDRPPQVPAVSCLPMYTSLSPSTPSACGTCTESANCMLQKHTSTRPRPRAPSPAPPCSASQSKSGGFRASGEVTTSGTRHGRGEKQDAAWKKKKWLAALLACGDMPLTTAESFPRLGPRLQHNTASQTCLRRLGVGRGDTCMKLLDHDHGTIEPAAGKRRAALAVQLTNFRELARGDSSTEGWHPAVRIQWRSAPGALSPPPAAAASPTWPPPDGRRQVAEQGITLLACKCPRHRAIKGSETRLCRDTDGCASSPFRGTKSPRW